MSTIGQAIEGNSLEVQSTALKNAGAEAIYSDAYTGTTIDRPEFDKLIGVVGSGDIVVVTKLDRVVRSVKQGLEIINDLIERGVKINILNMGVIDNTSPQGKLMLTVMLAFAEFERDMIIERTAEKAIKRSKGQKAEGRYALVLDNDELKRLLNEQQAGSITVDDAIRRLKICRTSWYKYTKEMRG